MQGLTYKDESYKIIGLCMDIHNILGPGFLEVVYKDALEYELSKANIHYEREKQYFVNYKEIILPHKFCADFVVFDKVILEIKAVSCINEEYITQALNYLTISKNKLALIVNFGEVKLAYKRVVK
jgi:GxxExxY protein